MKIETAPPEWLHAIVEAVCATLEINPAMLPADPHLAGEKVGEAIKEAIEDVDDGWPIGATALDGIPSKEIPTATEPKQREWLRALANRLESASRDARNAADAAEEAASAIDNEILALMAASKETPK